MELPEISSETNLTLKQAKEEYRQLDGLLKQTDNFPQGGAGWSQSFLNKINQRLEFVKNEIVNHVIKEN